MGGCTYVAGTIYAVHHELTRAEHAKIRAPAGTLRASLTQARDALMHFKGDHSIVTVEPAARRSTTHELFVGELR